MLFVFVGLVLYIPTLILSWNADVKIGRGR